MLILSALPGIGRPNSRLFAIASRYASHSRLFSSSETTSEVPGKDNSSKEKGKVVHPPGAPRVVQRSELYGIKMYLNEGPRDHLSGDGLPERTYNRYPLGLRDAQPQQFVNVDGQTYIIGVDQKKSSEMAWDVTTNEAWWRGPVNLLLWCRTRQRIFTNYDYIMKVDYCMFWIPTLIILSITVPTYCLAYMADETAYSSMTVKVIGRQWYWVYEVESPVDDDDGEDQAEADDDDSD